MNNFDYSNNLGYYQTILTITFYALLHKNTENICFCELVKITITLPLFYNKVIHKQNYIVYNPHIFALLIIS